MNRPAAIALLTLAALCYPAIAQMNPSPAAHSGTPAIASPAKAYDDLLSLFEGEMMGVVKEMPADKYDFAPSQAIFKDSQTTNYAAVRTFGQMVAHVAQANYMFYSAAGHIKPTADVKAIESLTKKEDLVVALAGSFAFAHQAIATLTPENSNETLKGPGLQTRATMAAYGIAHGYDHYGQLVEYLRMNGHIPPASAKQP